MVAKLSVDTPLMIEVSSAIAEVRTEGLLPASSNQPMFFLRMLLYKSNLIYKVTFSPKRLKENLEMKLKRRVRPPMAPMYQTYLSTLSLTKSSYDLFVYNFIWSLGISIDTRHFEKMMPNIGWRLPWASEQMIPIQAKMMGLLYFRTFLFAEPLN